MGGHNNSVATKTAHRARKRAAFCLDGERARAHARACARHREGGPGRPKGRVVFQEEGGLGVATRRVGASVDRGEQLWGVPAGRPGLRCWGELFERGRAKGRRPIKTREKGASATRQESMRRAGRWPAQGAPAAAPAFVVCIYDAMGANATNGWCCASKGGKEGGGGGASRRVRSCVLPRHLVASQSSSRRATRGARNAASGVPSAGGEEKRRSVVVFTMKRRVSRGVLVGRWWALQF